jgi:hypothetical protein
MLVLPILLLLLVAKSLAFHPISSLRRPVFLKANNKDDSSSFDMDDLRKKRVVASNPMDLVFLNDNKKRLPENVFIILFQPGTVNQGVHSIENGSGNNVILAFESKLACEKFAESLCEQHFEDPTVRTVVIRNTPGQVWCNASRDLLLHHYSLLTHNTILIVALQPHKVALQSLDTLVETMGVYAQLVPKEVDLIPPTQSVQHFGQKNPSIRKERNHLNTLFDMAEGAEYEEDGVLTEMGSWA